MVAHVVRIRLQTNTYQLGLKFGCRHFIKSFLYKEKRFYRNDALINTAKGLLKNLKELSDMNTVDDDHNLIARNLVELHEFFMHQGKNKMFNTIKRHIRIKNPKRKIINICKSYKKCH